MLRRYLAAPLALAAASILLPACSKKVGDDCAIGTRVCLSHDTMLVCDTGRFAAQGCKGKNGCVEPPYSAPPICDFSGDKAGDACFDNRDKVLCTGEEDGKITCVKDKYVIEPCRGPGGCMQLDNGVRCNRFVAKEGDACLEDSEGYYACDVSKKAALQCKKGAYIKVKDCGSSCEVDVTNNNMVDCR
jgi:hypothetical protein